MNGLIAYKKVSDRNLEFPSILSMYDYKEILSIEEQNFEGVDLFILDIKNAEKAFEIINEVRVFNASLAILWILDYEDYGKIHNMIKRINGIGKVLTMPWTGNKIDRIIESIESVLNPFVPVKKEEIAFVIPVYNEEERFVHVKDFLKKINQLNEDVLKNLSIYFIDDGSNDRSKELLENLIKETEEAEDTVLQKKLYCIHAIDQNTKKAGTYIEAFKKVNSDIIIFADADNGYELEDIMRMVNLLKQGYYDMVVGTKDLTAENRPPVRRMISFFKRIVTKPLLPYGITDSQTGLKIFKSSLLSYIIPYLDIKFGLAIDLKILHAARKLRLRVYEVPVRFYDREGSHVEVVKDSIRFLKSVLTIIFTKYRKEDVR